MRVDTRTYEERAAYFRQNYLATKHARIEAAKERYRAKIEQKIEYDRQRYLADPARYKDARIDSGRRWEERHPERVLAKTRRRAAEKLNRVPAWADHEAIRMMYRAADIAKLTYPEASVQVDHDIPLRGASVSGLHVANNLRLVPAKVNQSKGNRF